jgi:hypothetical protein
MNRDITSYLKVYNNFLDKQQCEKTVIELTQHSDKFYKHEHYHPELGFHVLAGEEDLDVSYTDVSTRPYIMQRIWDAYAQYTKELNFKWFCGWNGFEAVRFNRYSNQSIMTEHCDHIHSMFDGQKKGIPIMSALAILNDNYSGGELVFWNDVVIEVKVGDMLVFPSNFLYPHRVDPVTDGVRYSCVSWAY